MNSANIPWESIQAEAIEQLFWSIGPPNDESTEREALFELGTWLGDICQRTPFIALALLDFLDDEKIRDHETTFKLLESISDLCAHGLSSRGDFYEDLKRWRSGSTVGSFSEFSKIDKQGLSVRFKAIILTSELLLAKRSTLEGFLPHGSFDLLERIDEVQISLLDLDGRSN